ALSYVAPAGATYYLRVSGSDSANYDLVLTRGAAFDVEGNHTFATAQDITGTKGVLGHVASEDWYSINVAAGSTLRLETGTPADGPNQFVNTLNPHLELYDPSNGLVASGADLGDGRNEFIQSGALSAGTYRVRLTREGTTQGEYFLSK